LSSISPSLMKSSPGIILPPLSLRGTQSVNPESQSPTVGFRVRRFAPSRN